jgi:hypothetical protein
VDGFRATIADGRLVISEPWYATAVDWLILAFPLSAVAALLANAFDLEEYAPAVICLVFLVAAAYLFEKGQQKRFAFDTNTNALLRGRKALCGTSNIEAIVIEDCETEGCDFRVRVHCTDGVHHTLGEFATEGAAMHLATQIKNYTGLPIRIELT